MTLKQFWQACKNQDFNYWQSEDKEYFWREVIKINALRVKSTHNPIQTAIYRAWGNYSIGTGPEPQEKDFDLND